MGEIERNEIVARLRRLSKQVLIALTAETIARLSQVFANALEDLKGCSTGSYS